MASWSDCRIKALPLGKSFSPTEEPEPHTVVSDNIIDVVKELKMQKDFWTFWTRTMMMTIVDRPKRNRDL